MMGHDALRRYEKVCESVIQNSSVALTCLERLLKKIGIGIIGCGNISIFYLELTPLFDALEVRAVVDLRFDFAKSKAVLFDVQYDCKAIAKVK